MKIECMKLVNGMDIIFRDMQENPENNSIFIDKAVSINVSQKGLGFAPLTFFSKDAKDGISVSIDKQHVLFFYTPSEEIEMGYKEFSTGIQQVKPKIIGA